MCVCVCVWCVCVKIVECRIISILSNKNQTILSRFFYGKLVRKLHIKIFDLN